MYNIEYKIGLNEQGRPCIELPEGYEHRPEDRFFTLEVTRYILQDLLKRRTSDIDNQTINTMSEAERLLGQLGDEVAQILYNGMRAQGELAMMLNTPYHIQVNNIEERDALPEEDIIYKDKIFDRIEGLKVSIQHYEPETFMPYIDIYELNGGISNENWVKYESRT